LERQFFVLLDFLLLPKPQPATHGLKIHGLASPRQMPQLSDVLLRIYEVLLVRRALGLSIFLAWFGFLLCPFTSCPRSMY
jgi:hypothetical protein